VTGDDDRGITVVKLRGPLEPPGPWQEAGWSASKHIYANSVEEREGHYLICIDAVDVPWRIGRENVVDVRPPDHPGHPSNL
jgi:hypothetical protein